MDTFESIVAVDYPIGAADEEFRARSPADGSEHWFVASDACRRCWIVGRSDVYGSCLKLEVDGAGLVRAEVNH